MTAETVQPVQKEKKIKKVKYSATNGKPKVHILFLEQPNSGPTLEEEDMNLYLQDLNERPLPEFVDALQALVDDVISICELPEAYSDSLVVRSVSFTWKHGIMGATITAIKGLARSQSPLVLNTPHKPAEPYTQGSEGDNCLSGSCVERLQTVIKESLRYVAGERAKPDAKKEAPNLFTPPDGAVGDDGDGKANE